MPITTYENACLMYSRGVPVTVVSPIDGAIEWVKYEEPYSNLPELLERMYENELGSTLSFYVKATSVTAYPLNPHKRLNCRG